MKLSGPCSAQRVVPDQTQQTLIKTESNSLWRTVTVLKIQGREMKRHAWASTHLLCELRPTTLRPTRHAISKTIAIDLHVMTMRCDPYLLMSKQQRKQMTS